MSHTSLTALYRWEGGFYEIQASEIHDEIETYMQKHPKCSKGLAKENVLAKYGGRYAFQCFEGHDFKFHFWENQRESSHFQHPPSSGHPRENISPEDVCPCINADYQTGIRARLKVKQAVMATGVNLQCFCCTSLFQSVKSTITIPCGSRYLLNHRMEGKQGYKSGMIRTDAVCFDGKVIPFNISKRNRNDPASVNMVKLDPKHVIEACENTMGKTPPFLYPRAPDTKCSACTARELWCTAIRDVMQQNKERKEREEREREREEREREEREREEREREEREREEREREEREREREEREREERERERVMRQKKEDWRDIRPTIQPESSYIHLVRDDVWEERLQLAENKARTAFANLERNKESVIEARNQAEMTRKAKIATDKGYATFEDFQAAKEEQKRKRNEEYELKKNLPVQEAVVTPGFSVVISSLPLTETSEQDREAVMEGIAQKRMERQRRQEAKSAKRLKKRSRN